MHRGIGSAGWARIGGKRCYYRSSWERNFARYLTRLEQLDNIQSWEYEPHTFWFDSIRRGVRSYKPDFRVVLQDGTHRWYEVKGHFDAKSRTKFKRMTTYYPDEQIVLIDKAWFARNAKLASQIQNWE